MEPGVARELTMIARRAAAAAQAVHKSVFAAGWLFVREAGSAFMDLEGLDLSTAELLGVRSPFRCAAGRTSEMLA
jgi:hypothetical protein